MTVWNLLNKETKHDCLLYGDLLWYTILINRWFIGGNYGEWEVSNFVFSCFCLFSTMFPAKYIFLYWVIHIQSKIFDDWYDVMENNSYSLVLINKYPTINFKYTYFTPVFPFNIFNPALVSTYTYIINCKVKLPIHCQTLSVQLLKFGNE